jgi:hypothetical protein
MKSHPFMPLSIHNKRDRHYTGRENPGLVGSNPAERPIEKSLQLVILIAGRRSRTEIDFIISIAK